MFENEYGYTTIDYAANVPDYFSNQLEDLHAEIHRCLEEAARNQQSMYVLSPFEAITPAMSLALTDTFREYYLTRN
jgi:hypothetical protein